MSSGLLAGCGSRSSTSSPPADATPAAIAEKTGADAAPAGDDDAPAKRKKKKGLALAGAAKPAAAPARVAVADVSQWQLPDIKGSLARKEFLFAPAVVIFAARGANDATRAAELEGLLMDVAKMPDETMIALPLGPAAAAPPVNSATGAAGASAVTAGKAGNGKGESGQTGRKKRRKKDDD